MHETVDNAGRRGAPNCETVVTSGPRRLKTVELSSILALGDPQAAQEGTPPAPGCSFRALISY